MIYARPKLILRRHVVARGTSIYQPYFERYIDVVCGNVPERVREVCVRDMRVPTVEEQHRIILELDNLKSIVSLDSAEGAAMLLLRDGNEATLDTLVSALTEYHDALSIVRDIVNETLNTII